MTDHQVLERRVRAGLWKRIDRLSVRKRLHRRYDAAGYRRRPASILGEGSGTGPTVVHVANFASNAGDILLPVVLRDLFVHQLGPIRWVPQHAHRHVGPAELEAIDAARGTIIGGGGLFLRDSNPDSASGWQWDCSIEALRSIRTPLAVFAVGYNQFRAQAGFSDRFDAHVALLVEKAAFTGLRNTGSIGLLRRHLPEELHERVRYQPCMTTVAGLLYPDLDAAAPGARTGVGYLALNAAFDRAANRFEGNERQVLATLAEAVRDLSADVEVRYFAHTRQDEWMLPYLRAAGVDASVVRLYRMSAAEVLRQYAGAAVAVGMRGHAQMVPFGVGVPILSLVSHDKLRFFLDDVDMADAAIELVQPDLRDHLVTATRAILADPVPAADRVVAARARLWDVTTANVATVGAALGFDRVGG